MANLKCWNCGTSLDGVPRPISRHVNCCQCFEVLHCCRMCKWYAPGRPQDCDHDRADPPVEKEAANFCDYFAPTPKAFDRDEAAEKSVAKSKAAALFGLGDDAEEAGETPLAADKDENLRSKLDVLFDD